MAVSKIPGYGRKRPQLDMPIARLHLDSENPRLPEELHGKVEQDLLIRLHKEFFLDELADSMAQNGYFDEEPLVAIPQKLPVALEGCNPSDEKFLSFIKTESTEFTVVEGNRRLATVKLLLDSALQQQLKIKTWPKVSNEVAEDLAELPVILYTTRNEVVPYLGVRHIVGIQKWDSYAKARYIAKLIGDGQSLKDVEELIGDKQAAVRKSYLSYKLIQQAEEEFEIDTNKAKDSFSLLILALGQGNIKTFLGLPRKLTDINVQEPVRREKLPNLKNLLSWVFGDEKYSPVIKESRGITGYLSHVVASPEAVSFLEKSRDLEAAYDRTDGEEKMVIKYLATANAKLENVLGIAHRNKTSEVISEAERCNDTTEQLLKTLKG